MTTLEAVLRDVQHGRWPAPDGAIVAVPPPVGAVAAVVAFTAHFYIAADISQDDINALIPDGDLGAPLNPPFLTELAARTGTRVNNVDAFFLAPVDTPGAGAAGPTAPDWLTETDARDHPRIRRSLHYRTDVRVFACEGGLVVLGRGLCGRMEVAFEVDPAHQGRGLGRRLAAASRTLAARLDPACTHVWAQVAPGNAASMRAVAAAGFEPGGAEALLVRG